jgi:hypothetical protein
MELGRVGGQEPYRNRTSFFIALQNSVQLSPPDLSESRTCGDFIIMSEDASRLDTKSCCGIRR